MRKRLILLAGAALLAAAPAPQLAPLRATSVTGAKLGWTAADRKVIVVHYWATWCAPCRVEMPVLDAAYARHHASGVEMIGIALDSGASRDKIAKLGHVGFPLARLADTTIKAGEVPAALPETRIYGRDGRLRATFRAGQNTLDGPALDRVLATLSAER